MLAVFGEQELDIIAYWAALSVTQSQNLVEQKVIEGKPLLQYVGDNLDVLRFELRWHRAFCDPEAELATLQSRMASRAAYPLVMGNGLWKGEYAVKSIDSRVERTTALGQIEIITATAEFIEVVQPRKTEVKATPAVQKPGAGQPKPAGARAPKIQTRTVTTSDGYQYQVSEEVVRSPKVAGPK